MPAVKICLHELFGPERVEIAGGTATLIAEGAAWIASDQAGLRVAKNVELLLSRNSYLPLVKADKAMPKEGGVQRSSFHSTALIPETELRSFRFVHRNEPVRAYSRMSQERTLRM